MRMETSWEMKQVLVNKTTVSPTMITIESILLQRLMAAALVNQTSLYRLIPAHSKKSINFYLTKLYSFFYRCVYYKKNINLEIEILQLKTKLKSLQEKYDGQTKKHKELQNKLQHQKSYRGKLEAIIEDLKKEHEIPNEIPACISVNFYYYLRSTYARLTLFLEHKNYCCFCFYYLE